MSASIALHCPSRESVPTCHSVPLYSDVLCCVGLGFVGLRCFVLWCLCWVLLCCVVLCCVVLCCVVLCCVVLCCVVLCCDLLRGITLCRITVMCFVLSGTAFNAFESQLPELLRDMSLDNHADDWYRWMRSKEPEAALPSACNAANKKFSPFQHLLITQTFRPDRVSFAGPGQGVDRGGVV